MMNAMRGLIILALLSPIGLAFAQSPAPEAPVVMATVGKFNVTPSYLDYIIRNHFARQIMDHVIRNRVVADAAEAQGVRVTHEAVTARLEAEKAQFLSADDFLGFVRTKGLSEKGYREQLQYRMTLDALLDKQAGITEDKVRAYFEEHKQEYGTELQANVMHIVTTAQEDAVVAYRAVLDGTPFTVVARRFSDRDAPAPTGEMGWVSEKSIPVPELWPFVQALDEGRLTEPFELNGRHHIVQVTGRRTGTSVGLEKVTDDIRAKLRQEAGVNEQEFLTSLLAGEKIAVSWSPVSYLGKEYAQLAGIRVTIEGRPLSLLAPAYLAEGGVPMVPAKSVLQAVGATLNWRPGPKILEAKRGAATVTISVGEKTMSVGGEFKPMPAVAAIKDGITFIPALAVLPELGVKADWNATTKELAVTTAQ